MTVGLHPGKRLGPLRTAEYHRTPSDYDFLHAVTVRLDHVIAGGDLVAAGGGLSWPRARGAALGEALERNALRGFQPEQALVARASRHDESFLWPGSLLHYPASVFELACLALKPWHASIPIYWVEGHSVRDGSPVWVPAFAAHVMDRDQAPAAGPFDASVATGAACAARWDDAVLSGLFETIERDAFTIHWENRWPARIRPLPQNVLELGSRLEQRGFALRVGQLATDLQVSVAIAAVIDRRGGRSALGIGAAARETWAKAAFRAAEEAMLTSFWATSMHCLRPEPIADVWEEMASLPTPARHAFLYGFPQMTQRAAFLWEPSNESPVGSRATDDDVLPAESSILDAILGRVEARGFCPIAVDITDECARRFGCVVARVVVPGLVPLARGRFARPLRNSRLVTVPRKFGQLALDENGFNSDPHPFP